MNHAPQNCFDLDAYFGIECRVFQFPGRIKEIESRKEGPQLVIHYTGRSDLYLVRDLIQNGQILFSRVYRTLGQQVETG